MYFYMYICIYISETMMADCTIRDSTYVFLFSSEKLEKHKKL